MRRITLKDLDRAVDLINTHQGTSLETWTKVDGRFVPTAWNYHLSGANGGYALPQHGSSGSGVRDVFQVGHVPKRELYNLLRAYSDGLRAGWKHGVREVFTNHRGMTV